MYQYMYCVVNMSITVKIDEFGKIFIPKRIRQTLPSNEFEIIVKKDIVELIPVKEPIELFGTLKKIKMETIDEIHGEDHDFAS